MLNMNSNQSFYHIVVFCDIKKIFLSIFLASKRPDTSFRARQGTATEQLTVDSLLTPSE